MSDSNKHLSEQRDQESAPVSYRHHARNILSHPVAMVQGLLQSKILCLWILFICLQQLRRASIDSPGNAVTQHGTWLFPPIGRDTWAILANYILTIGLCIWTSLQLNIPMDRKDLAKVSTLRWQIYYSRLGQHIRWIIIGLLAPELVAYAAWKERREVLSITALAQRAQACVSCIRTKSLSVRYLPFITG